VEIRRPDYSLIMSQQLDKILLDYEQNPIYLPQAIENWVSNTYAGGQHSSCDIGKYVALLPNGDMYPCVIMSQKGLSRIGNVYTGVDWEILDNLFVRPTQCKNCPSPLCSGGCTIERNGSIAKHNCENMQAIEKVIRNHRIDVASNNLKWIDFYLKEGENVSLAPRTHI
jgi:radical SAM protein with 4Fe4S-binding SPASM domain